MCSPRCSELASVLFAILSLVISICCAVTVGFNKGVFQDALAGLGTGAEWVDRMSWNVDWYFGGLVIICEAGALVICLSTFDCPATRGRLARALSSSRSLCVMRIIVMLAFVLHLAVVQLTTLAFGAVSFLTYLCHLGMGVQYHTQSLIYSIGNSTLNEGEYNPYGGRSHEWDTPIISAKETIAGFSMHQFCTEAEWSHTENLISADKYFYLGFLFMVLALFLMAVALHGEKERVTVHELSEKASGGAYLTGGGGYGGSPRDYGYGGSRTAYSPVSEMSLSRAGWNERTGLTQY